MPWVLGMLHWAQCVNERRVVSFVLSFYLRLWNAGEYSNIETQLYENASLLGLAGSTVGLG